MASNPVWKRGKKDASEPFVRPTRLADSPFESMAGPDDADSELLPPTISQAPLPPVALTADRARAVRFRMSKPQGYYALEVDEYVSQTIQALEAYEERDYAQQVALHEAQEENDRLAADRQRLQATIEIFKVNGAPVANADGSYMTESQADAAARLVSDAQTEAQQAVSRARDEADEAERRAAAAEQALRETSERLAAAESEAASLREYAAQAQAYIEQVSQWAEQAQQGTASQPGPAAAAVPVGAQPAPSPEDAPDGAAPAQPEAVPAVPVDASAETAPAATPADPGTAPAPTPRLRGQ